MCRKDNLIYQKMANTILARLLQAQKSLHCHPLSCHYSPIVWDKKIIILQKGSFTQYCSDLWIFHSREVNLLAKLHTVFAFQSNVSKISLSMKQTSMNGSNVAVVAVPHVLYTLWLCFTSYVVQCSYLYEMLCYVHIYTHLFHTHLPPPHQIII